MSDKFVLAIDEYVDFGSEKNSQCDYFDREFRNGPSSISFQINLRVNDATPSAPSYILKVLKVAEEDGSKVLVEDEEIESLETDGQLFNVPPFSKNYRGDFIVRNSAEAGARYFQLRESSDGRPIATNYKSFTGDPNEDFHIDDAKFIVVDQCSPRPTSENEHEYSDEIKEDHTSVE